MDSGYVMLVEYFVVASGWIGAIGVAYASTHVGIIGVAARIHEMLPPMLEVPLQVLETVG